MNLPVILDIAIALVFIYLILSLLASEIQEIIAAFLQWRAKNLKEAIETLLGGSVETKTPSQTGNKTLPSPLETGTSINEELGQLPVTEMPSQIDNETLPPPLGTGTSTNEELGELPVIEKVDVKRTITFANELYQHPLIQSLNQTTLGRLGRFRSYQSGPSYIPSETFASALLEILKLDEKLQEYRVSQQTDKSIVDAINDIQRSDLPSNVKDSLIALAVRARRKAKDIDKQIYQFEREVETWFNRSMERASGVYKRNAKGAAILLSSLIAFGTNADTLHIFSMLSKDSVLSAGISQYANQTVQNCKENLTNDKYLNCVNNQVNNNELSKLSLPIGWNFPLQSSKDPLIVIWTVFKKIIGWLLTGLAISMGATFWFDLLNRFINVRYAGKKPASSNETSDSSK